MPSITSDSQPSGYSGVRTLFDIPLGSLVACKWSDAVEVRGPATGLVQPLDVEVTTFGVYLGYKEPNYAVIVKEYVSENGTSLHYNCIPVSMILDIRQLGDRVTLRAITGKVLEDLVELVQSTPVSSFTKGLEGRWI